MLLNDLGLLGYSGHVGARLPCQDAIVIQARDQARSKLAPGDLLIGVLPLTETEIADFSSSLGREHFVGKAWTYYVTLGPGRGVLPADWETVKVRLDPNVGGSRVNKDFAGM